MIVQTYKPGDRVNVFTATRAELAAGLPGRFRPHTVERVIDTPHGQRLFVVSAEGVHFDAYACCVYPTPAAG